MRRKRIAIYFAVLSIFSLCVGAAFAAMGKVEGFSFTGTADKDLAGVNSISGDGKPDAEFNVKIGGTAGALSGFTLKNLTTNQEWSTASGAQNVLVVADSKNSVVNSSFPAVAFLLTANFKVYANDRAAIVAAGGEFEITVKFVDGSTATARTTVAAVPTQANAQAAAQTLPAAAPAGSAAATAGSGTKLISSAYRGPGGYDLSDGTKKVGSNMNPDHRFDISLAGEDTLTGIRIRATGGGAAEKAWDTVPTTGNPLVVVTDQGKGNPLNNADGSISIPITNLRDLSLWVDGSNDLAKQDFRLTLLFTGGRIEEADIKQAAAQAPVKSADIPARSADNRQRGPAIGRAVQMSAKPAQIKLDVVGKNRLKKASGTRDFSLVIKVRGQGSIEAISLANQTGKGRWDTIPGSSAWLMLVRKNNKQVSDTKDFSVSIPVKGNDTLELLLEDDGALAKKNARFLLAVTWDDGEIMEELLTW
ncbi:MAG: hypothetical protein LBG12_01080 [Synergistaceae bacterium]|jgi:hypothetical protein|nr:hypothetical protein [Synergistaceae bacterium]